MNRDTIIEALTRHQTPFRLVEHPPAETTRDADAAIDGLAGVRTKSLFLVNRKRTRSYLLIADDRAPLDLDALADTLGESRLSLGSRDRLVAALGLEPGVVSPFGLIDPDHRGPRLLFDRAMLAEPLLTFHPGDNRATLFIGTTDLLDFLTALGIDYAAVDATGGGPAA